MESNQSRNGSTRAERLALVLVLFNLIPAAHAGGGGGFAGATEYTQILNNVELVQQTIQDQMRNVQLVQQTYLAQLQQMAQTIGPYTAPYQNTLSTLRSVQNTLSTLGVMQGNVSDLNNMLNTRFQEYSASNLNFNDWQTREQNRIADGDQAAQAELVSNRQVIESTQSSLDAYQQAAAAMDKTTGTHQATRVLGAQLTLLGGDLNKLITVTSQANIANANQRDLDAAERERQRAAEQALEQQQDTLNKRRTAEIQQLMQGAAQ
jgi:conjugal transfer/entry exclusion protein